MMKSIAVTLFASSILCFCSSHDVNAQTVTDQYSPMQSMSTTQQAGRESAPVSYFAAAQITTTRKGSGTLKDPAVSVITSISNDGLTKKITKTKMWLDLSVRVEKEEREVQNQHFVRSSPSAGWKETLNSSSSTLTIVDFTPGLSGKDAHRQTITKVYENGALHSTITDIMNEEYDDRGRPTHLQNTKEVNVSGGERQFAGYVKNANYIVNQNEPRPLSEKTLLYNTDGSITEIIATFYTSQFSSSLPVKEALNKSSRTTDANGILIQSEDAQHVTQWYGTPNHQAARMYSMTNNTNQDGVESSSYHDTVYDKLGQIRHQYASYTQSAPKNTTHAEERSAIDWYGFYDLDEAGQVARCDGRFIGSDAVSGKEREEQIRGWVEKRAEGGIRTLKPCGTGF